MMRGRGTELIDEEGGGAEVGELSSKEGDMQDEMQLAQDGTEDGEAAKQGGRDESVSMDAHVESSLGQRQERSWMVGVMAAGAYRRGPRRSNGWGRNAKCRW
jgi:hypothetical protein